LVSEPGTAVDPTCSIRAPGSSASSSARRRAKIAATRLRISFSRTSAMGSSFVDRSVAIAVEFRIG
jgi:hypothetical protein